MTKNLKVWQKLALLGVIFLVPFAWVTWKWISTAKAQELAQMRAELAGVRHLDPLRKLQRAIEDYRDTQHAWLSGDTNLARAAEAKRAEVDSALAECTAVNESTRALVPVKGWSGLLNDFNAHLRSAERPTTPELFDRRIALTEKTLKFMNEVGVASGLNRENHAVRSRLTDVLEVRLPETVGQLSQLRGRAAGLAAGASPAPDDFDRLTALVRAIEKSFKETSEFLVKAGESSPRHQELADAFEALHATVTKESLALAKRMANERKAGGTASTVLDAFERNVGQVHEFTAEVGGALRGSLDAEVERLTRESMRLWLWVILWLVLIFTMCAIIMRDITRPLSEVVAIADRIADGNLAANIPNDSRTDEMGVLIRSFNRMSQSLSTLVGQVQRSGASVNSSITHIAATGREQQSTADAIARTTSEIGTTARDISATSRELLETMNAVAGVAEGTGQLAGSGREGLARMEEMVRQITDASALVAANFRALSEKAANINQVVTTITKIADRTNLLSLNAAIEAEKAGEYGRGFSVVATEVRRLADQTAVATYDIEQMVKEIQAAVPSGMLSIQRSAEEVRRGAEETQRVSAQLGQIIQQVQALLPRFEAVNVKMRSQAAGGEQITERLDQLSRSVQLTAHSLQQSNQAIEQLRATADGLREGVARFKLP